MVVGAAVLVEMAVVVVVLVEASVEVESVPDGLFEDPLDGVRSSEPISVPGGSARPLPSTEAQDTVRRRHPVNRSQRITLPRYWSLRATLAT